jgi:hypothetical protein
VSFAWRHYHIDVDGEIVDDGYQIVATGTARRIR